MKILIPLVLGMFGLAAAPVTFAQGCCGTQLASAPEKPVSGSCPYSAPAVAGCGHETNATNRPATQVQQDANKAMIAARAAIPNPVRAVFEQYILVQSALAQDSVEEAKSAAAALVESVRADTDDTLPPEISAHTGVLAKAVDLEAARAAFKPLSESLLKFAKSNRITPGAYVEVYCGMAKASWLQGDREIRNPYHGGSMLTCGQLRS